MQPYANRGGDAGVVEFKIGDDRISVLFRNRKPPPHTHAYTYTYATAGAANVEAMKLLAQRGKGLNEFLNTNVRDDYERL